MQQEQELALEDPTHSDVMQGAHERGATSRREGRNVVRRKHALPEGGHLQKGTTLRPPLPVDEYGLMNESKHHDMTPLDAEKTPGSTLVVIP